MSNTILIYSSWTFGPGSSIWGSQCLCKDVVSALLFLTKTWKWILWFIFSMSTELCQSAPRSAQQKVMLSFCQPTQAAIHCFHGWGRWWCNGFASWEAEGLIKSMGTPLGRWVISDIQDFVEAQAKLSCALNLLLAVRVAFSYCFHGSAPAKPTGNKNFSAQIQYLIPYACTMLFKGLRCLYMVPDWIIWGD